ncbi:MAG: hypothetical protein EOM20_12000 [Spartobacteria bacterium]|nr:hypothetical protein [Spartobacteria bacterium]
MKTKNAILLLITATCLGMFLPAMPSACAGPYSTAQNDPTNPYDAPIPGYVGPHGDGIVDLPDNRINPVFAAWASQVVSYTPAAGVSVDYSNAQKALGPATGDEHDIVALGDLSATQIAQGVPPGQIILGFDVAIANLDGPDFAVFENSFQSNYDPSGYIFSELAFVEVATQTNCFARFPAHTLVTEADLSTNGGRGFAAFDPTGVYNLAGKHINKSYSCWGTPFDLDDLTNHPHVIAGLVDLMDIHYVRLVDIPGNGAFHDGAVPSNPIYDAWPTLLSGGFDLEAVGVINFITECRMAPVGAALQLQWMAHTNRQYQVQWTETLRPAQWHNAGGVIAGDDALHTFEDTQRSSRMRVYRIVRSDEDE